MNVPIIPSIKVSHDDDNDDTVMVVAVGATQLPIIHRGEDDNPPLLVEKATITASQQLSSVPIPVTENDDDDDDDDDHNDHVVNHTVRQFMNMKEQHQHPPTNATTTTTSTNNIHDINNQNQNINNVTQPIQQHRVRRRFTAANGIGDGVFNDDDDNDDDDTNHRHNNHNHRRGIRRMNTNHSQSAIAATATATSLPPVQLTEQDVALCQALDMEYDRAIEERQIAWTSRYQSVRQSTVVSILFMLSFIGIGTIFFINQAAKDNTYWSVSEGLLFSIYTITTVGYGHLDMPDTVVFQWYIIIYIFVGIATLTILVAQIYQCIALETNRVAVHANDTTSARMQQRSSSKMRQWVHYEQQQRRNMTSTTTTSGGNNNNNSNATEGDGSNVITSNNSTNTAYAVNNNDNPSVDFERQQSTILGLDWVDIVAYIIQCYDITISFLRENEYGRSISVLLPFLFLITIGAVVIGPIEGWTVTESIYFSVVSLTTVGFGDYYPTKNSSIWFCCIWLPFSVGFMSLYLSNVAAFYIRLSDRNIARIENVLRKRIQSIKEKAQLERQAVLRRALRGQQQDQQHDTNSNDHGSTDGGSSSDNDLAFTINMDENGGGDDNVIVDDSKLKDRTKAVSNKRLRRLNSNRFFGFNTIPTDDRFDSDNGGGGGGDDSFSRDNSINSLQNDQSSSIYSSSFANTSHRRERILRNSRKHVEFTDVSDSNQLEHQPRSSMTMTTMKDVLRSVHQNNMRQSANRNTGESEESTNTIDAPSTTDLSVHSSNSRRNHFQSAGPESEYLSVRSNRTVLQFDSKTIRKKPSFALRALVQERFAEIIATDIAGYHNSIEIKDCTLTVTITALKKVADKWLIPRRARKAFRAVAFEALYFVGEHGLITRGAEALFSLSPIEFHQIFSPLLASFGDVETMESWLEHTQALADVDLSIDALVASTLNSGSRKEPPISLISSRDLHRSQGLPVTVMIPSQHGERTDDLPEIA